MFVGVDVLDVTTIRIKAVQNTVKWESLMLGVRRFGCHGYQNPRQGMSGVIWVTISRRQGLFGSEK